MRVPGGTHQLPFRVGLIGDLGRLPGCVGGKRGRGACPGMFPVNSWGFMEGDHRCHGAYVPVCVVHIRGEYPMWLEKQLLQCLRLVPCMPCMLCLLNEGARPSMCAVPAGQTYNSSATLEHLRRHKPEMVWHMGDSTYAGDALAALAGREQVHQIQSWLAVQATPWQCSHPPCRFSVRRWVLGHGRIAGSVSVHADSTFKHTHATLLPPPYAPPLAWLQTTTAATPASRAASCPPIRGERSRRSVGTSSRSSGSTCAACVWPGPSFLVPPLSTAHRRSKACWEPVSSRAQSARCWWRAAPPQPSLALLSLNPLPPSIHDPHPVHEGSSLLCSAALAVYGPLHNNLGNRPRSVIESCGGCLWTSSPVCTAFPRRPSLPPPPARLLAAGVRGATRAKRA